MVTSSLVAVVMSSRDSSPTRRLEHRVEIGHECARNMVGRRPSLITCETLYLQSRNGLCNVFAKICRHLLR